MSQWLVLFKKEVLEMWRNYKWIWIPTVFILLGVLQPLTAHYMPQILEANNLPKEMIENIPIPTAPQVLVEVLSHYGLLGILILVLSFMASVAGEKQNGSAVLVLVKPVSHLSYITAKWTAITSATLFSFALGYLAAWYYTGILVGEVSFIDFIASLLVYSVWLIFVVTVTLFFSTWMKSNGAIAFLSILTIGAISIATSLFSNVLTYSPSKLNSYAGSIVMGGGELGSTFWYTMLITIGIIILCIVGANKMLQRQDIGE